jgi:hypothetical protein
MEMPLKTFALAILFLAPAACGGGGSSGGTGASSSGTGASSSGTGASSAGTGGATASGTAACKDQAAALCGLRDGCGPSYDIARVYGSQNICVERNAQSCINGLDAKGQGNTPDHVEGCAAAYPSEACADFFDSNPVAACVPPAGTLAMGAPCGAPGQCASTYCALTPTSVCGTCQPLPAAGAPCQVQADCGRDLACAVPSGAGSGVCAAWVDSGGQCLTGVNPCKNGLACVGDDPTTQTMGTCQTQPAMTGAMCQTTRKSIPNCGYGFACIVPAGGTGGMGTCQPINLVSAGAMCGSLGTPVTSVAQCKAGGLCQKAAPNDATGTCVAAAADNAPCDSDPSIGPPCLAPAKCVPPSGSPGTAGTCVVPNAATCM